MCFIRWVGEIDHSLFLQSSSCDDRVNQLVVKIQFVYGQRQPSVEATHNHTTPTVVVVLVSHIDDNAAIVQFKWLWMEIKWKIVITVKGS